MVDNGINDWVVMTCQVSSRKRKNFERNQKRWEAKRARGEEGASVPSEPERRGEVNVQVDLVDADRQTKSDSQTKSADRRKVGNGDNRGVAYLKGETVSGMKKLFPVSSGDAGR